MKPKVLSTIFLLCCLWISRGHAQERPTRPIPDSLQDLGPDTVRNDTLLQIAGDTIRLDQVRYSRDSLEAPIEYNATDSMIYDIANRKIHLYGNAYVKYTTITLKAAYIVFDWTTNIVTAEAMPDSANTLTGLPEFTNEDQRFEAKRMRYNFLTQKGKVYDVTTKYNDIIVHGSQSKFISGRQRDSTEQANDILYSEDALFTTCTHPEPHFGIHSRKQKIIPDKLVVVGPSNLEIMNVPTPLWLPFGFFPITKGRRTGLLFPRDYEFSPQWGFGLRDIGWFFPLGDHYNLAIRTNIYLKGTWGISATSQYRKRYKYSGNINLAYDSRRSEDNEGQVQRDNSFAFTWNHNQDASAHPTNRFGGSINFRTNRFQQRVFNDAERVLQNQINSNFSFQKNWQDLPFSFSALFNHSQNDATGRVTVNFPTLQFQTQSLYPFKRQNRGGNRERWYENIVLRYTGEAKNRFEGPDTAFFSQKTWQDAQFGVRHDVTAGNSFKLLKYFNFNPGINYKEVWYLNTIDKNFIARERTDTTLVPNSDGTLIDTIISTSRNDTIEIDRVNNFRAYRQYSMGISLNTQIFGTLQFRKGPLRGLRHVIKPSVSFNYSPNYLDPDLGYFDSIPNINNPDRFDRYSVFEQGIFGGPPSSGRQMAIGYSLNNIFEAKFFSRKDSTDKKIKLFDNIIASGNYNFAADSLKWSQVFINGTTRFFKGMTTVSFTTVLDPYMTDSSGRRINKTVWSQNRKLLRFDNANARFNTAITVGKIRALFQGKEEEVVTDIRGQNQAQNQRSKEEDFLSLFERFSINHNLDLRWQKTADQRDTFLITTNSINVRGDIQLTPNWRINVGNFGYDFVRKGITYPSVGFSRDLHCWEMGLNWAPTRGTYNFYIRVKPGTLDFIKIPYQRNNADGIRAFQ